MNEFVAYDRYKRTVGVVILTDGRVVNVELVRAGMCWWYRRHVPHNQQLAQAEQEARATKRGLWADVEPVPPWKWRNAKELPLSHSSIGI